MLLALMVVIGIIANRIPSHRKSRFLSGYRKPLHHGDTFYYVLYGMLGRAIGMMDTQSGVSAGYGALFIIGVIIISRGTLHELQWRGNFADTWYLYCGPMVFICTVSLLTLVKNT